MDRWAIIRDGQVESIIMWDGKAEWSPPAGTTVRPATGKDQPAVAVVDVEPDDGDRIDAITKAISQASSLSDLKQRIDADPIL